jgi:hypothetical protein
MSEINIKADHFKCTTVGSGVQRDGRAYYSATFNYSSGAKTHAARRIEEIIGSVEEALSADGVEASTTSGAEFSVPSDQSWNRTITFTLRNRKASFTDCEHFLAATKGLVKIKDEGPRLNH